MQCALLSNKDQEIELIRDLEVLSVFEKNIRGGFTSVIKSHKLFNNPGYGSFRENEPVSSGMFIDVNSLYGLMLTKKLPVGKLHELTQEEIENFNILDTNPEGEHAYALLIDYEIPDDFKKY